MRLPVISSPEKGGCVLIVTDLTGRELFRNENMVVDENYDFGSGLADGIYFAEVIQGDIRKVLRIVKSN